MDIHKVKKLLELINKTNVSEIEVRSGEESIRISRFQVQTIVPTGPSSPLLTASTASIESSLRKPIIKEKECFNESIGKLIGHPVKSPMVGTVYLAPVPEAKPFVEIGQQVLIGHTICLIEAMKMFNKIEADKNGIISARFVENEQPVEFDQLLFIIEPNE